MFDEKGFFSYNFSYPHLKFWVFWILKNFSPLLAKCLALKFLEGPKNLAYCFKCYFWAYLQHIGQWIWVFLQKSLWYPNLAHCAQAFICGFSRQNICSVFQTAYLNVLMNYDIDPVHWAFLDNPHFLQSRNHLQSCILTRKLGLVPESEITKLCYKPLACNSWSVMFRCFASELHYCSVWVLYVFLEVSRNKKLFNMVISEVLLSQNCLVSQWQVASLIQKVSHVSKLRINNWFCSFLARSAHSPLRQWVHSLINESTNIKANLIWPWQHVWSRVYFVKKCIMYILFPGMSKCCP